MKRLLVLLVATLGTGCVVSDTCDAHDIRVTWDSFLRADGTVGTCSNASVNTADQSARFVDVYIDGDLIGQGLWACTDHFLDIAGVLTGTHDLRVEALDSNQVVISRDELEFTLSDSCSSRQIDTQPAEGYVTMLYAFFDHGALTSDTCFSPTSRIWLSITDEILGDRPYLFNSPSTAPLCEVTQRLRLPLASGSYTLDWMEERDGTTLTASDCTPRAFTVGRAENSQVDVDLEETGLTCH